MLPHPQFLKDHSLPLLQVIVIVNIIFFSQTSFCFSKVAASSCSKEAITKTTGTNYCKSANNQLSNMPPTSGHHLLGEAINMITLFCYVCWKLKGIMFTVGCPDPNVGRFIRRESVNSRLIDWSIGTRRLVQTQPMPS